MGRQQLHRFAERIVKSFEFIAVEALQICNMLCKVRNRKGMDRAIAEPGWGRGVLRSSEVQVAGADTSYVHYPYRLSS